MNLHLKKKNFTSVRRGVKIVPADPSLRYSYIARVNNSMGYEGEGGGGGGYCDNGSRGTFIAHRAGGGGGTAFVC